MITTICFVDNTQETYSEAFRILEDNGILLIGLVDKKSDLGKKYLANRENSNFYKDANFFSTSEVLCELKNAGFIISDFRQTLIPNKNTMTILSGYGEGAFVVIKAIKREK